MSLFRRQPPQYDFVVMVTDSGFEGGRLVSALGDIEIEVYGNGIVNKQNSFGVYEDDMLVEDGETAFEVVTEDFGLVTEDGQAINLGYAFGEPRILGNAQQETILGSLDGPFPTEFVKARVDPAIWYDEIDLRGQVADAVALIEELEEPPENSLVTLYFAAQELASILGEVGTDDLIALLAGTAENMKQVADAYIESAIELGDAGYGTFVYMTNFAFYTPDAAEEAAEAGFTELLRNVFHNFNDYVGFQLKKAGLLNGFDVVIVDTQSLVEAMVDDPDSFNIVNPDTTMNLRDAPRFEAGENFWVMEDGEIVTDGEGNRLINDIDDYTLDYAVNQELYIDQDQILWFDPSHPNANTHDVMGLLFEYTIDPEKRAEFLTDAGEIYTDRALGWRAPESSMIVANGGNDIVRARGGDDIVYGGMGNDDIHGGSGNDVIAGGSGDDALSGDADSDVISGNSGDDAVYGGDGDDALFDMLGSDLLNGGAGDDVLYHVDTGLLVEPETDGEDAPIYAIPDNDDVDVFDGGDGDGDILMIAVNGENDPDRADAVMDELETVLSEGVPSAFELETLGLSVANVERVILFDQRGLAPPAELLELGLSQTLVDQLVLADYAAVGVPFRGEMSNDDSILFDTLGLA